MAAPGDWVDVGEEEGEEEEYEEGEGEEEEEMGVADEEGAALTIDLVPPAVATLNLYDDGSGLIPAWPFLTLQEAPARVAAAHSWDCANEDWAIAQAAQVAPLAALVRLQGGAGVRPTLALAALAVLPASVRALDLDVTCVARCCK